MHMEMACIQKTFCVIIKVVRKMKGGFKSWDLLMRSRREQNRMLRLLFFPETEDERTYKAAEAVLKEGTAEADSCRKQGRD